MKVSITIYPFIGTDLNKQESFCRTWTIEEIADGLCPFYTRHWMHDEYHYLPNIPESGSEFGKFPVPKKDTLTLVLHVLRVYRTIDSVSITVQGFDIYEGDTRALRDPKDIIKIFTNDSSWESQAAHISKILPNFSESSAGSRKKFPSGIPIDARKW